MKQECNLFASEQFEGNAIAQMGLQWGLQ